ncbi:MAG: SIS domain-containing protein [Sandarakinorhabdus sp.]|nr:SIS domain-containing protein [Sandarakinorhabdus sp.]
MIAPMLLQRIQQQFIDSADLNYQCAQTMAPAVEAAVGAVLSALTGGGKVLACGNGMSIGLVQAFVAAFVGRFERERPELAAFALGSNAAALTGLYSSFESRAVLGRQVRALGLPGDVLLLVTTQPQAPEILGAVEAAHERDMVVVALCGAKPGPLLQSLKDTDVLVSVPSERLPRVHEAHQLALHCICDGVDVQLLGEDTDPEIEP